MRVLLDTHVLFFWALGSPRLSQRARRRIGDPSTEVLVSAASAWEIATKHRLGKLPGVETLLRDLDDVLTSQGFCALPISVEHARRAGLLTHPHKDPFDRMLAAQALTEDVPLVSLDSIFDEMGVERIQ